MSKADLIDAKFGDVPYMDRQRAEVIRDIIVENNVHDVIEIGFYQGKSSAYIGSILEDCNAGHLSTIDLATARKHSPNIEDILDQSGLSHRVTPFFAKRSYTWELQRLINADPRPQFDLCYFDGGHTWDSTGFGVLLIDMLLRPGGLLLLDDMDWAIGTSRYYEKNPKLANRYDADEADSQSVRLVWDSILPHLGYEHLREYPDYQYGLARKKF